MGILDQYWVIRKRSYKIKWKVGVHGSFLGLRASSDLGV